MQWNMTVLYHYENIRTNVDLEDMYGDVYNPIFDILIEYRNTTIYWVDVSIEHVVIMYQITLNSGKE